MSTLSRSILSVLLTSLTMAPLVWAQPGQPRPATGRPAANPFGIAQASPFGVRVLKPRALEDRPLDEKEEKKYDAMITSMEKRAAAGTRAGQTANRGAALSAAFRKASTQLRHGQELAAKESFEEAWKIVPELYREPRTATIAAGQVRTHLREIQTLAASDPELALTFMSELSSAHQQTFDAIELPRSQNLFAQPLAQTWFHLMLIGQLDKESLEKGTAWALRFPQVAVADRPLPPEQVAEYEAQLTQVSILATQKLRQLAERHMVMAGVQRPAFNPSADTPESVDPVTAQVVNALDAKRGPISRFMEADVHFRFGQFRNGINTTMNAWRELMEFYGNNPANVSPVDTEVHFESLARIAGMNPIQALVMLDRVDPMYRTVLQANRFYAVNVADAWAELASVVPLTPPMLTMAGFWLELVSKQHKDLEAKYSTTLEQIKAKLEQGGKADASGGAKTQRDDAAADGAPDRKQPQSRRGIQIPQSVDPQVDDK